MSNKDKFKFPFVSLIIKHTINDQNINTFEFHNSSTGYQIVAPSNGQIRFVYVPDPFNKRKKRLALYFSMHLKNVISQIKGVRQPIVKDFIFYPDEKDYQDNNNGISNMVEHICHNYFVFKVQEYDEYKRSTISFKFKEPSKKRATSYIKEYKISDDDHTNNFSTQLPIDAVAFVKKYIANNDWKNSHKVQLYVQKGQLLYSGKGNPIHMAAGSFQLSKLIEGDLNESYFFDFKQYCSRLNWGDKIVFDVNNKQIIDKENTTIDVVYGDVSTVDVSSYHKFNNLAYLIGGIQNVSLKIPNLHFRDQLSGRPIEYDAALISESIMSFAFNYGLNNVDSIKLILENIDSANFPENRITLFSPNSYQRYDFPFSNNGLEADLSNVKLEQTTGENKSFYVKIYSSTVVLAIIKIKGVFKNIKNKIIELKNEYQSVSREYLLNIHNVLQNPVRFSNGSEIKNVIYRDILLFYFLIKRIESAKSRWNNDPIYRGSNGPFDYLENIFVKEESVSSQLRIRLTEIENSLNLLIQSSEFGDEIKREVEMKNTAYFFQLFSFFDTENHLKIYDSFVEKFFQSTIFDQNSDVLSWGWVYKYLYKKTFLNVPFSNYIFSMIKARALKKGCCSNFFSDEKISQVLLSLNIFQRKESGVSILSITNNTVDIERKFADGIIQKLKLFSSIYDTYSSIKDYFSSKQRNVAIASLSTKTLRLVNDVVSLRKDVSITLKIGNKIHIPAALLLDFADIGIEFLKLNNLHLEGQYLAEDHQEAIIGGSILSTVGSSLIAYGSISTSTVIGAELGVPLLIIGTSICIISSMKVSDSLLNPLELSLSKSIFGKNYTFYQKYDNKRDTILVKKLENNISAQFSDVVSNLIKFGYTVNKNRIGNHIPSKRYSLNFTANQPVFTFKNFFFSIPDNDTTDKKNYTEFKTVHCEIYSGIVSSNITFKLLKKDGKNLKTYYFSWVENITDGILDAQNKSVNIASKFGIFYISETHDSEVFLFVSLHQNLTKLLFCVPEYFPLEDYSKALISVDLNLRRQTAINFEWNDNNVIRKLVDLENGY